MTRTPEEIADDQMDAYANNASTSDDAQLVRALIVKAITADRAERGELIADLRAALDEGHRLDAVLSRARAVVEACQWVEEDA